MGYRDVRRANSRSLSPFAVPAAYLALARRRRPPCRPYLCPGRPHEPQGLRASTFSQGTCPKAIVQRRPIRNPPFFKDGPAGSAGSSETGTRFAAATAPLLCFVPRRRMSHGACAAPAVWHSHGDCIAGAMAQHKSGSPIAHPYQQRDTPTAYQNVLSISLAPGCRRDAACRPELFFGLCGPAKFSNSVHRQRLARILEGRSLSGPANAAAPSPQTPFLIDGTTDMMIKKSSRNWPKGS
jgi:hypothetical protein